MKKNILLVFIIFIMVFGFINVTEAKNAKTYTGKHSGSFGNINLSYSIDKDSAKVNDQYGIVQIYVGNLCDTFNCLDSNILDAFADWVTGDELTYVPINFYTSVYDPAMNNKDDWWASLYFCVAYETQWFAHDSIAAMIYTDSMASLIQSDGELGSFKPFLNGEESQCTTIRVEDIPEENQISFCKGYSDMHIEISEIVHEFEKTHKSIYKNKYNEKLEYLKSKCKGSFVSADWDDACISRCARMDKDLEIWNKVMDPNANKKECGFSARLLYWVRNILNWIKFILPVIVIVLGILDFIKAMSGDKDDEMKKAQGRFIKRLIAAALAFIVPLIIVFVLDKMGFGDYIQGCGVIDV